MADHGDIFFRASSERRMRQKVMDEDSLEMVLTNFNDQKVHAIRRSIILTEMFQLAECDPYVAVWICVVWQRI